MINKEKMEHWKQIIEEHEKSGLSLTVWCEQNQIKRPTYHYWKQRIVKETIAKTSLENTNSKVFAKLDKHKSEALIPKNTKLHFMWKDLQIDISSKEEVFLAAELIKELQKIC
jgi:hypothetical protein